MKAHSFFALMTGLAVGTVVGMLFAPESGANSRAKLKKAVQDCLDELNVEEDEKAEEDGKAE